MKLKASLCLLFFEELSNLDWNKLENVCKSLSQFKRFTMTQQETTASVETAK